MSNYCKVVYFAAAKDFVGGISEEKYKSPSTIDNIISEIELKHPGFKKTILISCNIALNYEYIDYAKDDKNLSVNSNDEIAIIPPVSSG